MSASILTIDDRPIGPGYPPYVVAELSANHRGKLEEALKIMCAAKKAGADAVKLQTYRADTMTIDHDGPEFILKDGIWAGQKIYDLLHSAHMPWEWHEPLFALGRELGLTVFSTPFDPSAVHFLEQFDPPAYKVASFELVDLPLIRCMAETGKPLILSTGMASKAEIADAVSTVRQAGIDTMCVLHCVSGYPTPPQESNLRTMQEIANDFDVIPGLSDHSLGTAVAVAAVALGACVIEKHFTLDRSDGGPDASFSIEPDEMRRMVDDCRTAFEALGTVRYGTEASEEKYRAFRRSLYVVRDMEAGEVIDEATVRSIRPGLGLAPKHLDEVLGRVARVPIRRGTPLDWNLIE